MKGFHACAFAGGTLALILVYLPAYFAVGPLYPFQPDFPRMSLPAASEAELNCCPHHLAYVSLDNRQRWTLEGSGVVAEDILGDELKRMAEVWERSGYRPSLAVRISADRPARHFLRLHKIANNAGIEDFAFAALSKP